MYIINSVAIVYHQHEVLYIIKPQVDARYSVMRYSPTGADDIHDCVVMIYQACGLDKKIRQAETCRIFWRRHPDLNRGMKVLQTLALPLGYSAK